MTRDEIIKRYYESIQKESCRLFDICENNQILDKLLEMDTSSRDHLFSAFKFNTTIFKDLCELVCHIDYCFEDDGALSLVYIEYSYENTIVEKTITSRIAIVVDDIDFDLMESTLLQMIIPNIPNQHTKDCKILEWSTCRFYEEEFDWVCKLTFPEMTDVRKQYVADVYQYFIQIRDYINSHNDSIRVKTNRKVFKMTKIEARKRMIELVQELIDLVPEAHPKNSLNRDWHCSGNHNMIVIDDVTIDYQNSDSITIEFTKDAKIKSHYREIKKICNF